LSVNAANGNVDTHTTRKPRFRFSVEPMMNRRTFLASTSVLMGRAAFPSVLAAFASSACSGEEPQLVSAKQMQTLRALVDVILPATDSPAASAANTHVFVDTAAYACATKPEQAMLRGGLNDLEHEAKAKHGRSYADLAPEEQAALLRSRAEKDAPLPYDQSFFKILKDYTLVGYFLSEIGATQALAYEQIPGGYEGDIPLDPGQKAWAI
jgi:hypothetical protein